MSRRRFLQLVGGSALAAACGAGARPRPSPPPPGGLRAITFDLFTIFDPRGVDRRVAAVVGEGTDFAAVWKTRLFEYCWIRAAAQQYADFEQLVHDSLDHAARTHHVELTPAMRAQLVAAFTELELWPDAQATLRELRSSGLVLAPLANFAPAMIARLLDRAGLRDVFAAVISTDRARTYKPDPRAYALAETVLGLPHEQIAFAAFGRWDAAGARWAGMPTFWVNRLGAADEALMPPDASGSDLVQLAAWVATRR